MRYRYIVLVSVLFFAPAVHAQSRATEVPNARVVIHKTVEVKNPNGIFVRTRATSGETFGFDAKCGIEPGAILIGIVEKSGRVLAKYSAVTRSKFREECPNGTLLFVSVGEFEAMYSVARPGYTVKQELEMKEVEKLLSGSRK